MMFVVTKRCIAGAALCFSLAAASASAHSGPPCQPLSGVASLNERVYGTERCSANATPHVSVNGHELLTAELSSHGSTATFYGQGSVVRLDQRHGRVRVNAATTDRLASIWVWFTRYRR